MPSTSFLSRFPLKLRGFRIGDFKLPSLGFIRLGGYRREDCVDAWARYLPPPPQNSKTTATPKQETRT